MPDVEPVADEEYAPASGRHRTAPRSWRAARVTRLGPGVLPASARLLGEQVRMMPRDTVVTAGGHTFTARHCSADATKNNHLWLRLPSPDDEFGTVDLPVRVLDEDTALDVAVLGIDPGRARCHAVGAQPLDAKPLPCATRYPGPVVASPSSTLGPRERYPDRGSHRRIKSFTDKCGTN